MEARIVWSQREGPAGLVRALSLDDFAIAFTPVSVICSPSDWTTVDEGDVDAGTHRLVPTSSDDGERRPP